METTGAAQTTRSGPDGAVVLSSTQISLAVGVVGVCCLMAFGGGVITGMWYKVHEQSTPYVALHTASEEAATVPPKVEEPPAEPAVTFYDALKGQTKYAPMNAAANPRATTKTSPLTPGAAAPTAAKAGGASGPDDSTAATPKTLVPAVTASHAGNTRTTTTLPNSAPSEPSKSTPAAPLPATPSTKPGGSGNTARPAVAPVAAKATAVKPVVALAPALPGASALKPAAVSPGAPSPVASAKDRAAARSSAKDGRSATAANVSRPAEGQPGAGAAGRSGKGQYSVQAGSFQSPEQAERLRSQLAQKGYQARVQQFIAPNNESWYRVRVGNYSERAEAGQTAHNLTAQEQLHTVVANDQR